LDSGEVDWIDFFVNPGKLPEFIDEVIRLRPKLVWCQIGVVNADFNAAMEKAQIPFIVDLCPKIELERSGT
jgi:predicted CoA-binding protein